MKNIRPIFLITLLISIFCNAQRYEITYTMEQITKQVYLKTVINTYLRGDGQVSIYEEDFQKSRQEQSGSGEVLSAKGKNPVFYKDTKTNHFQYNGNIGYRIFLVDDLAPLIKWSISEEIKEILGHRCQKASGEFRGRNFTVYFAKDIPVADGPWKLTGLPGLILEAFSDDVIASFHITASEIKFPKDKIKIENPYAGKDLMTFAEFEALYNRKYQEALHNVDSDGDSHPMSKGFKEYFVK